jgi:hypothetical protein
MKVSPYAAVRGLYLRKERVYFASSGGKFPLIDYFPAPDVRKRIEEIVDLLF